ncbi:MAG TPA: MFS transporter [Acidimicrobiia bacterium]|nr:MFS transporter [Acidimicrobiia bacterium]
MAEAVAPLRVPAFRALWLASVFSSLGTFLQAVAGAWLMLELTDSATWVGLMVASNMLPILFLGVLAGAVADLFDRTKVMIVAQSLSGAAAVAMAVVTATGHITPGLLLVLGLVLGVGVAFNLPAWQSFVPDLVPRGMVASAVALNSVAFNVARAIGPAIGGVILATAGAHVAFGLNALSYAAVVGVLVTVGRKIHVAGDPDRHSMTEAMALGLRFARFTLTFRRVLALAGLFAISSAVIQAVLPSRTLELGGAEWTYGLLLGSMGLGALAGAFTRPQFVRRLGARAVPTSMTVFGVFGVLLGLTDSLPVAVGALVAIGACWVWSLTTLNATAQLMAPDWVRGRAMSLYSLAFAGIIPVGSALSGLVADIIGAGAATATFSAAAILLGVAAPRFAIPALADVESPVFDEADSAPPHADTEGGPVLVSNTWIVDGDRLDEFMAAMHAVRLVRMRTGAYRWRLYRNADEPHRLTEVFLCVSWADHLAMHRRIDDASRAIIRRAISFDITGKPTTRHLVAVDMARPADWDTLVSSHVEYHRSDGSIPLDQPGTPEP